MERFGLPYIADQEQAKQVSQKAIEFMFESGEFNKNNGQQFIQIVYDVLISSDTKPIAKLMTLHVLKQLTYYGETRFFSIVSISRLYELIISEAKSVDPKKAVGQKGLKKFDKEPETGRKYMGLLLELITFWGQKFAKNKNSQPTKFKKSLTQLKSLGVYLPQQYFYINPQQYKPKSKRQKQSNNEPQYPNLPSSLQQSFKTGGMLSVPVLKPTGTSKLSTQLQFAKNKINIYIADLEDIDQVDKLEELIHAQHEKFVKEEKKLAPRAAEVEQDESLISDFFAVTHFLTEENEFYNKYVKAGDFASYIAQIKLLNETTFVNKSHVTGKVPSPKPQQNKRLLNASNELGAKLPLSKSIQMPKLDGLSIFANLYKKIEERASSKSPGGFAAIQNDLEKSKQMLKSDAFRKSSRSRSPRQLGNNSKGSGFRDSGSQNLSMSQSLTRSKIDPIFASVPNKNVPSRSYQGQLITQNRMLQASIMKISRDQSFRRFLSSNFRQKNPLLENQHLQIGYISEAVYEEVTQFPQFLALNLFIGNKTDNEITNFQVEYKGDQNQQLFVSPSAVQSRIAPGHQNKQDLMVVPKNVPFGFITMNVRYMIRNMRGSASVLLPNSILKYAVYKKMPIVTFTQTWPKSRILKTSPFKLSKHIPPDSFTKYVPTIDYLTDYNQFSKPGSITDLQMCCEVTLAQKHHYVLKINIRPNLQVVVQLGIAGRFIDGQAQNYAKFYLQTLAAIIRDNSI